MPRLNALTPMLRVPDLDASISFYVDVLGFEVAERNDEWGWACLALDDVEVMLSLIDTQAGPQPPAFTGSLYFRTDDVDALWERVRDKARVCYGPEDFFYGMREFAVYDGNGYLLQFGQPIG